MSFYGLSTLQKINSKSASKWFGTAKIGEYLLILADFYCLAIDENPRFYRGKRNALVK